MLKNKCLLATMALATALCGCSQPPQTEQIVEEEQEVIYEAPTSFEISFDSQIFNIPIDMAMFHNPNTMYPVSVDREEVFLTLKGMPEDVCMLRSGALSANVVETAVADDVIKQYCSAEYYNSFDIVYSDTMLCDSYYIQSAVTTTLEDKTNAIFSVVPKGTSKIYSITFMADQNGFPVCGEEDIKIVLASLQGYVDPQRTDDYFYQMFNQFLMQQKRELTKYRNCEHIPILKDEQEFVLEPETTYYLELETGLYTLCTLEGEGEIEIEDSRFGLRHSMLGYDSANAPINLQSVTLVHGGGITTNMGLRISIVK